MTSQLSAPPVLSTPDNHILGETEPAASIASSQRLSDEEIYVRYEIAKTVQDIRRHRWRRVALQFPDHMLPDSAKVYQLLARGLQNTTSAKFDASTERAENGLESSIQNLNIDEQQEETKLTILGDTSFGSCCVDEIAAEHVNADVVVHYGRSCLSPTARLPVVHVFTTRELDLNAVADEFRNTFPDEAAKVLVTADIPYAKHVEDLVDKLGHLGYTAISAASITHDPSSLVPNRTVPTEIGQDPSLLKEWDLFHISDPPTSLLLTLSSRMKSVHILSTSVDGTSHHGSQKVNSSIVLRRRYALITSLSTVSTWGILINTLSVKNYLHIVDHVKEQIARSGKKSYLFVVGKLNAAKVANFAEIGGWVVIGCWESSLVDSTDFFKPIITPFELDMVLAGDENRVWTGEWRSDFQGVLDQAQEMRSRVKEHKELQIPGAFIEDDVSDEQEDDAFDSEEESAPPEFDLRTGRYVSHTRPTRKRRAEVQVSASDRSGAVSNAMVRRSNGELLAVKGVASPAAEFLAQKRTWRGLGSDFEIKYEDDEEEQGGPVEEGRTGVARGYSTGDSVRS